MSRLTEAARLRKISQDFKNLAEHEGLDPDVISHLQGKGSQFGYAANILETRGTKPNEIYEYRRHVNPKEDDLVTAIRKIGGIDVNLESDWDGRLSHLNAGFNWPSIEQTKGGGFSLDDIAEKLCELGYLNVRDVRELEDKLSRIERGEKIYSLAVDEKIFEEMWIEHAEQRCRGIEGDYDDGNAPF